MDLPHCPRRLSGRLTCEDGSYVVIDILYIYLDVMCPERISHANFNFKIIVCLFAFNCIIEHSNQIFLVQILMEAFLGCVKDHAM